VDEIREASAATFLEMQTRIASWMTLPLERFNKHQLAAVLQLLAPRRYA
jgi:hypothetical protein